MPRCVPPIPHGSVGLISGVAPLDHGIALHSSFDYCGTTRIRGMLNQGRLDKNCPNLNHPSGRKNTHEGIHRQLIRD